MRASHLVAGLLAGNNENEVADVVGPHISHRGSRRLASASLCFDPPAHGIDAASEILDRNLPQAIRQLGSLGHDAEPSARVLFGDGIHLSREEPFAEDISGGCHDR